LPRTHEDTFTNGICIFSLLLFRACCLQTKSPYLLTARIMLSIEALTLFI
jgi:hypothetical protein